MTGVPLALTVRQPYAAAILWGGKTVENRSWMTSFRGRLYIHAATNSAVGWRHMPMADVLAQIPRELCHQRGLILGSVQLTDCIRDSGSPWAQPGMWHWVLCDPVPLADPVPARGQRRLWTPPGSLR
jgi:hypothetical protein